MAKTPDETPIANVDGDVNGDVDKYENLMLTPNGEHCRHDRRQRAQARD